MWVDERGQSRGRTGVGSEGLNKGASKTVLSFVQPGVILGNEGLAT